MKCANLVKKIFAFVFAAIVLFTVSVHETHYLFSEHHSVNEHCENHLHKNDGHADCAVCKFDISLFTDCISFHRLNKPEFFDNNFSCAYQSVIFSSEVSSITLRGPPFMFS